MEEKFKKGRRVGNLASPESDPKIQSRKTIAKLPSDIDDIDLPVAKRKGVRKCTKHLISKQFAAYGHLSKLVQALVTNLSPIAVLITVQEAWEQPEWKNTILEEMKALEKAGTWEVVQKPKDIYCQYDVIGCLWLNTKQTDQSSTIKQD